LSTGWLDEDWQYVQQLLTHNLTANSVGMYIYYDDSLTMRQATADFQILLVSLPKSQYTKIL